MPVSESLFRLCRPIMLSVVPIFVFLVTGSLGLDSLDGLDFLRPAGGAFRGNSGLRKPRGPEPQTSVHPN
jgi:hypothetical protein